MYKANQRHLQPLLISTVNDLPEKHRKRLEQSWSGTFYRETFCRIPEDLFQGLYASLPSRPNVPVNLLVGLDLLKAQFGWSDEELYDHFTFDVQVRYALGYHSLKEGDFDLRTLYYFRHKLAEHHLSTGENLLQKAFEQRSDQGVYQAEDQRQPDIGKPALALRGNAWNQGDRGVQRHGINC